MTPYQAKGLALRNQPKPQMYFERPLRYYLNLGFQNGFVLDGFEERAFPPEAPQTFPLGWGGNFSEIPPVVIGRFRKLKGRPIKATYGHGWQNVLQLKDSNIPWRVAHTF